jgi:HEAT repeat protein
MKLSEWLKGLFPSPIESRTVSAASVETLMFAMKDTDPSVRRHAILALGEKGEYCTVEGIIAALDDRDDEVRLAAVVALGKIGDQRAVEPLIRKLKSYDYFYVRKTAAYTLYTFLKQERLDEGLRQKIRAHWRSWYLT